MEIQTIDSRELSELDAAAWARTLNLLLVVPHYLAICGLGYVMWGPRLTDSDSNERDPVTVSSLPEIRALDLALVHLSLVSYWPMEPIARPSEEGLAGVEQIEAEALLADDVFWASATEEQAAFRLAVRGSLASPHARAARAAHDAIFVRRVAPEPEEFSSVGNLGPQN